MISSLRGAGGDEAISPLHGDCFARNDEACHEYLDRSPRGDVLPTSYGPVTPSEVEGARVKQSSYGPVTPSEVEGARVKQSRQVGVPIAEGHGPDLNS